MIRAGRDQGGHVEGATNRSTTAADTTAALPLATLARMRSQSGEGGGLATVEGAQFGQFGEHSQGGDRPDAGDGFELVHALPQWSGLRAQRFEEFFDLFEILFEPTHEALGLATQGWDGQPFGLL